MPIYVNSLKVKGNFKYTQVEKFQVEKFQSEKFQVEKFQVEKFQVEKFQVEKFQVEKFFFLSICCSQGHERMACKQSHLHFPGTLTNRSPIKAPPSTPSPDVPTSSPPALPARRLNSRESMRPSISTTTPLWPSNKFSFLPPPPTPPPAAIQPSILATRTTPQTPTTPIQQAARPQCRTTVSLSYYRGLTEQIGRAMRKAEVGTISNNKNPLHQQLVYLKDKVPHIHKSQVVYFAPCAGKPNNPCTAKYIGEPERAMSVIT
jgi:hypothetical protein